MIDSSRGEIIHLLLTRPFHSFTLFEETLKDPLCRARERGTHEVPKPREVKILLCRTSVAANRMKQASTTACTSYNRGLQSSSWKEPSSRLCRYRSLQHLRPCLPLERPGRVHYQAAAVESIRQRSGVAEVQLDELHVRVVIPFVWSWQRAPSLLVVHERFSNQSRAGCDSEGVRRTGGVVWCHGVRRGRTISLLFVGVKNIVVVYAHASGSRG